MKPRIELLPQKKLVGKHMRMSLSYNHTGELWRSFMIQRAEITNASTSDFYSITVYDQNFDFINFDPSRTFEKWAAIEVSDFNNVPESMEQFILKGGLYAVFIHIGGANTAPMAFRKIFTNWIPNSPYSIDDRPHFEILGPKYKNNDPASEEEIWIPVKPRK